MKIHDVLTYKRTGHFCDPGFLTIGVRARGLGAGLGCSPKTRGQNHCLSCKSYFFGRIKPTAKNEKYFFGIY